MTRRELIEVEKNNAVLCTLTEQIDARFLNECFHLK
jgi:hypothetical protein